VAERSKVRQIEALQLLKVAQPVQPLNAAPAGKRPREPGRCRLLAEPRTGVEPLTEPRIQPERAERVEERAERVVEVERGERVAARQPPASKGEAGGEAASAERGELKSVHETAELKLTQAKVERLGVAEYVLGSRQRAELAAAKSGRQHVHTEHLERVERAEARAAKRGGGREARADRQQAVELLQRSKRRQLSQEAKIVEKRGVQAHVQGRKARIRRD